MDNEVAQRADRVDFRIMCRSKRKRNFTNQSFSSKVENAKMAQGKNKGADRMNIEKTSGVKSVIGKIGKKLIEIGGAK